MSVVTDNILRDIRAEIVRSNQLLLAILRRLPGTVDALERSKLFFGQTKKGEGMPLQLVAGNTDTYSIVGEFLSKKVGAPLPAGATATLTSADPLTVILTPDPSPLPTPEDFTLPDGTDVPGGTATQASGVVSTPVSPAQIGVPITVTLHLANADGSPVLNVQGAPIADTTDTVTVVAATDGLENEGVLFGK